MQRLEEYCSLLVSFGSAGEFEICPRYPCLKRQQTQANRLTLGRETTEACTGSCPHFPASSPGSVS
jgi:hypothetical protein